MTPLLNHPARVFAVLVPLAVFYNFRVVKRSPVLIDCPTAPCVKNPSYLFQPRISVSHYYAGVFCSLGLRC